MESLFDFALEMFLILPFLPLSLLAWLLIVLVLCYFRSKNFSVRCRRSALSEHVQSALQKEFSQAHSAESAVRHFIELFYPAPPVHLFSGRFEGLESTITSAFTVNLCRKFVLIHVCASDKAAVKFLLRSSCISHTQIALIEVRVLNPPSSRPDVWRSLHRIFAQIQSCYPLAQLSAFATDQEAAWLLEYLADYGAASKVRCAAICDPDFSERVKSCTNANDVVSVQKNNRFPSVRQRSNSAELLRHGAKTALNSHGSFTKSVSFDSELIAYGLPENLDDLAVPVLWIRTKQVSVPQTLFQDSLHLMLLDGTSFFQMGIPAVLFSTAVTEFIRHSPTS